MTNGCSYECNERHFGFTDCKAQMFYTSQCGGHKIFFVLYRGIFFFFALAWIIADIVVNREDSYAIYLTNWTEVTGCVYFGVAFAVSLYGSTAHSKRSDDLRWIHWIDWILFNVTFSAALITDLLFWGFLSGAVTNAVLVSPFNIISHAINFLMILIDLFVSRFPIRLLHFIYPASYSLVYGLFTLILHWSGTRSAVYSILHWSRNPGLAAGLVVAMVFVALPVAHVLCFGLYHLRELIARRCCVNAHADETTNQDEVEMGENNLGFQ